MTHQQKKLRVRWISGELLREILTFPKCVELMRKAMKLVSQGEANLPLRMGMRIPDSRNLFGVMPGYLGGEFHAYGAKLISLFPENAKAGFPSHMGLYALYEASHGQPISVMDANALTAIRTAAATVMASNVLSRNDAAELLVVGNGEQAENHLLAFSATRKFERVFVWGRSREKTKSFAEKMSRRANIEIEPVTDLEHAARTADVITTVTSSPDPLVSRKMLSPGAHVNAVGSSTRETKELDADVVAAGQFFVDYRESAMNQAGELLTALQGGLVSDDAAISAEIGEVLLGKHPGRSSDDEITVYKSLGVGAQDIAAATYVYDFATQNNIGVQLTL